MSNSGHQTSSYPFLLVFRLLCKRHITVLRLFSRPTLLLGNALVIAKLLLAKYPWWGGPTCPPISWWAVPTLRFSPFRCFGWHRLSSLCSFWCAVRTLLFFSPFSFLPLILQIHHRHPGVGVGVEFLHQAVVFQVVPHGPFEAPGAHPVDDVHLLLAVEHRLVDEPVHQR